MLQKRNYVKTTQSSLSVNNDYNSLILTALRKLRHTREFASPSMELSMYFEGAKDNIVEGNIVLEKINFNSNTARYRRTLTYAAMIIDQMSYSDKGSAVGTDSFIINFDRLFEDFVAKVLKEVPEQRDFCTWESKKKLTEVLSTTGIVSGERKYQPDILYRYKAEDENYDYLPSAYAVLDVKNKAYGQFKNADIYQMLTYVNLLHSNKAVLLYPSFYNRKPEKLILNTNIFSPSEITACFVNIADKSGYDFLESIKMFADTVVKIIQDIPI